MPFPIVSCSYHHLDLKSFGVVIKFYVTDLTLTSIVALIRPEDESGIGAGLWTLAARLIEFTDSEREQRRRKGTFDRLHRPSVSPSDRVAWSMEKKAISIQVACALLFYPFSNLSASFFHLSDDSSCNVIFSSGDIEFRHFLGLGTGTNSHKIQ